MAPTSLLAFSALLALASASCISSGDQTTINSLFSQGGAGTVVQLCPGAVISISDTITFTANDQEISTQGYPTDDTRATIQVASGTNVSTLIQGSWLDGIRIKNIQLDGTRPVNGMVVGGGANIEIGGGSNGQIVENIVSKNPRGWSCLHIIQSGNDNNPCTNATVANNQIGPCGEEGTDAAGNGQWADGISFACTNSLVANNTITGSTDGGIVLFGAPGTTVTGNTITSSADNHGFGAINMVDNLYGGSYANVLVTDNVITGQKLFSVGISIGAYVWSFNDPFFLSGPATITNNKFAGNITFPIAINGWTGGLTVTGNDVSQVNKPNAAFADDVTCSAEIKTLFNEDSNLVYYPAGLTGTANLQSGFIQATQNATNFICTTGILPSEQTYQENELNIVSDSAPFATLHGDIVMQYQGDNNVVVYNTSTGSYVPMWASGHTVSQGCGSPSLCRLIFQGDGNLVTYYNNTPQWSSGTAGVGKTMNCLNEAPWIEILDASGNVVWTTADSK
ncbi:hypothetical protein VTN77DRAFT_5749 [Rasamsonia byssochlamydoides]|uniref:uncharacterized protein n=1 Tax=Rasamsonia byssochlamydoides TaxID=89139 RepID=UPI0037443D12